MIPSPLVPVEGALARPRINPLDQVPPFGREWRFLGAPGARSSKNCLATLTTSCIDVDWPHSACRWQPLPATALPASGGLPAPPAAAAGRRLRHRRPRDRRAMYALYWSIGALGIIGWLIGTYDPPAGFGPAYAIQATGGVADHVTTSTGTIHMAATHPATSTNAVPQRKVAAPVANTIKTPPATHRTPLRFIRKRRPTCGTPRLRRPVGQPASARCRHRPTHRSCRDSPHIRRPSVRRSSALRPTPAHTIGSLHRRARQTRAIHATRSTIRPR
ncbi:hypothetical protein [Burkholderia cenocepacia]|uniref:hypothetical protein n=1 Tax=Burkholderia cenocepacia TaxID=95486 RepID=UPI001E650BB5|nr:hypothetical protein [Burkholderia cenocepacia]